MQEEIFIRMATEADSKAILDIYAPYVTDTPITFEYVVPPEEEFAARIRITLVRYPYIVALIGGAIVGYAYASSFRDRAAYDWSVETSVYVKQNRRGMGIGKKLYQSLESILRRQHFRNMYACIAYPNPESIAFHERMGFKTIGHFSQCGYKCQQWHDMIWMGKIIGDHPDHPQAVIPISQIEF